MWMIDLSDLVFDLRGSILLWYMDQKSAFWFKISDNINIYTIILYLVRVPIRCVVQLRILCEPRCDGVFCGLTFGRFMNMWIVLRFEPEDRWDNDCSIGIVINWCVYFRFDPRFFTKWKLSNRQLDKEWSKKKSFKFVLPTFYKKSSLLFCIPLSTLSNQFLMLISSWQRPYTIEIFSFHRYNLKE